MGMRSGIEAGKAFIKMTLDDEEFAKSLEGIATKFQGVAGKFAKMGAMIGAVGGAMLLPFIKAGRTAQTFGRQLDYSARRLGVAASELHALSAAAGTFGVTLEGLEIGIKTLGERVIQLEQGSTNTAYALTQLGIAQKDFLQASTIDKFKMIAKGMATIDDASRRAGLGLALLGEAGFIISAFVAKMGAGELDKLIDRFSAIRVSDSAIDAVGRLNVEVQLLGAASKTVFLELFANVEPILTKVAEGLNAIASAVINVTREMPLLSKFALILGTITTGVGGLFAFAGALSFLASKGVFAAANIGGVVKALKALKVAIWGLATTPLGWALVALSALVALLSTDTGMYAMTKAVNALRVSLGLLLKGLGGFAKYLGAGGIGDMLESSGTTLMASGANLYETREEFNERTGRGPRFDESPGASANQQLNSRTISAGIMGGQASQMSLGLAGAATAQTIAEESLDVQTQQLQRMESIDQHIQDSQRYGP